MATCPMCNVEIADAEMDNHTNTEHPKSTEGSDAGGEDTSEAASTSPPAEPSQ